MKFALMAFHLATGDAYAIDTNLSKADCLQEISEHKLMTHVELEPGYLVGVKRVQFSCFVQVMDLSK